MNDVSGKIVAIKTEVREQSPAKRPRPIRECGRIARESMRNIAIFFLNISLREMVTTPNDSSETFRDILFATDLTATTSLIPLSDVDALRT